MLVFEKPVINLASRAGISLAIVAAVFFIFAMRLWYLQVVRGDYFLEQSQYNLLRTVHVPPPRGLIFDRYGRVLVRNRPSFNIDMILEDSPDSKKTLRRLAELLNEEADMLIAKSSDQRVRRRFEPKLILKDVSRDVMARVVAHKHELPGIVVNVVPARDYLHKDFAPHIIGYLREITREQLDDPRFAGYRRGDIVGQYGIEALWERMLQGQRGEQVVIVNAGGIRISEASFKPEVPGHNIWLTIDYDVQLAADVALRDKMGAIVALDPSSGEILAMSSAPGFDPNMFAGEVSIDQWRDLVSGRQRRMNNRAVQGAYPPGSTFKIFMAIAGLEEGVVFSKETVNCPGYYYFGRRNFRCHKRSGHGLMDLYHGMIKSCDVYFYTLGARLGIDRIHDYATRFGLGRPTGLSLVQENPGLIPSTSWKRRVMGEPWYAGETISVAIGQGAVSVTPLQLANSTAAVVNGGRVMVPYLTKKIESNDGRFLDDNFHPVVQREAGVDKRVLSLIKEALVGVVNDPGGTGKRGAVDEKFNVKVGGKTGTAQVVALDSAKQGGQFDDHAWFVGYAPHDNPEIVVSALVENGGGGGAVAAPLVREVLQAYFEAKLLREKQKTPKEELNAN